ncbi:nucleoside triphosphate pyrophosphohydrolase [Terrihabitans rhizophilus]|uniref:Nucleoside triphosphate pyrophosphohydrolase n=1 Tax=Terrihabitans rhizophilus TaxID=3092662 RepID=A0ABU4RKJ0_9HYPH|nr:nucleoside triphosphate pyrophosphohydrolase [Terrihabitans sp. PJ23]MDX6805354.1 nucleoside triphosphate pyrophosphohydrolase [Terrihabitans sp. PJ23]
MTPSRDIADLLSIMAALRDPDTGCAWDLKQTFESIAPYTLEEAAEVVEAIARRDIENLREELGDLLLQVVFHSRIAEEAGHFAFEDVVEAITAKLVRRHPHIFGDTKGLTAEDVKASWDRIKAEEKAEKAARGVGAATGLLDSVPADLPPLSRAVALQAKAGKVGFDWNSARLVLAKIREEADEVEAALDEAATDEERLGEIGDLLFAVANLARHVKADPEVALRRTNAKFERRFRFIEDRLAAQGRTTADAGLEEMDAIWNEAKAAERSLPGSSG